MQRPVFYAITIIITAYLPIFTLEKVEGRIFRPMAWTVAFALLGAMTFSILVVPVLASFLFPKGFRGLGNPVLAGLPAGYRRALTWTVHHRWVMVGAAVVRAVLQRLSAVSADLIGSEFLPHLDEGSIWAFGTAGPQHRTGQRHRVMNRARMILASFPEVKQVISRVGRPDDGMDPVGLRQHRVLRRSQAQGTVAARVPPGQRRTDRRHEPATGKIPGVFWHFTQPIADEMEEAETGIKGQLAVKIFGEDLNILEEKGDGGGQGDAPDPRHRRPRNACA